MSDYKTKLIKVVSKFLKRDILFQDFFKAVDYVLNEIETAITETKNNFFFDTMTADAVLFMEKLLKIIPTNTQTLENRRDVIRAKWRSNGHNCIVLIQNICNAWKNGEVEADFIGGKIQLKFVGEYGVPDDLEALKEAVSSIKPSHIAYYCLFKYLLIENIHEVKTIEEMAEITIDMFAYGVENYSS